jgi:hypothetical protein
MTPSGCAQAFRVAKGGAISIEPPSVEYFVR